MRELFSVHCKQDRFDGPCPKSTSVSGEIIIWLNRVPIATFPRDYELVEEMHSAEAERTDNMRIPSSKYVGLRNRIVMLAPGAVSRREQACEKNQTLSFY